MFQDNHMHCNDYAGFPFVFPFLWCLVVSIIIRWTPSCKVDSAPSPLCCSWNSSKHQLLFPILWTCEHNYYFRRKQHQPECLTDTTINKASLCKYAQQPWEITSPHTESFFVLMQETGIDHVTRTKHMVAGQWTSRNAVLKCYFLVWVWLFRKIFFFF